MHCWFNKPRYSSVEHSVSCCLIKSFNHKPCVDFPESSTVLQSGLIFYSISKHFCGSAYLNIHQLVLGNSTCLLYKRCARRADCSPQIILMNYFWPNFCWRNVWLILSHTVQFGPCLKLFESPPARQSLSTYALKAELWYQCVKTLIHFKNSIYC